MLGPTRTRLSYAALDGWPGEDVGAAIAAYARTFDRAGPGWPPPGEGRDWIEGAFTPVLIEDGAPALFTGYFEPELDARRSPAPGFPVPLYALPPGGCTLSRREIEETGALAGHEIAWLADPVDAFFLQVQGSGRLRLDDGTMMRVGFAGRNGHPYASVGRILVERGEVPAEDISPEAIRDWIAAHPDTGHELLWQNPSFVFFRERTEVPAEDGPIGTMGRSITALRSVAVDPATTPLGSFVWVERAGATGRLMVAQDTGSAIRGAQRADIFVGTGQAAGRAAGAIRDGGRMIALLPNHLADRL